MSKFWSKIMMCLVAVFVIGINNANADLQCVREPSCAMLGYSKANVENCTGYIHCPFDTSYKKCVTLDHTDGKCTGYSLTECPPHAKCEPCGSYKITSCRDGYKISGNTCICATTCTDRLTQNDIPLNAGPIKQSCDACGAISDIITGWECNSGYVNVNDECKKYYDSCEDAGFVPNKPDNATCSDQIVYLANADALKCYSGCACNDGYVNVGTDIDSGMICEQFIDCSAYTLDKCPDNADCGTCTDNWGKTTYQFNKCNSGYAEQSGACVCEKVCLDKYIGTIPANATAVKEVCEACGVATEIVTGWTCNSGYVKAGDSCQNAYSSCEAAGYLTNQKANATCSTASIYLSNGSTKTCYKDCKCNNNYVDVNGTCKLYYSRCEDAGYLTNQKANATCSTASIYLSNGSTKTCYKDCKCNNNYADVNGTCQVSHNTCEAAGYLTNPKANATCSTTSIYLANGSQKTCYTACKCNNGYTGDPCVCATTCSDKITTKPENSHFNTGTCTACGVSSTIKTGWSCDTGYHTSGSSCVCDKTCTDQITSKPANSSYTTTTCAACGKNYTINIGWACNSGYTKTGNSCEKIADCSAHTLTSCPTNAVCSSCTSNSGANAGKTTYRFENCANNYTLKSGVCVCATTCSDRVSSKPDNSTYTTTTCTACGVSSTIKTGWSCNTGYHISGSNCVCDKTCTDQITSKPANSSYTTTTCTACGKNYTINIGWACNSGYTKIGNSCEKIVDCSAHTLTSCPSNAVCSSCTQNSGTNAGKTTYKFESCANNYTLKNGACVCATTCSDRVSSKPENSHFNTETCTACGVSSTIKTGWSCNTGYHINGNTCVCDKTCTDQITSKPAYSSYTYTSCTACGSIKDIATGWTCNSGYLKVGSICQKYYSSCEQAGYLTSQKANAICSIASIYLSNGSTKTCYSGCTCKSGYTTNSAGNCVCATSCADKYTGTLPAHAHYDTETCTACGVSSTIKTGWSCDTGYVKVGNTCQKYYSSCEAANYLASPKTNATCSTTSIYLSSGSTKTCYSGCTCKSGYTGDPCVCATTCADKVTSKPTNASWSYESCTACGSSYSIKSGWTCNTGYVKSGNDCVCPSGTYRTQSACESANPYSNCTLDVKCYKPTSCKSGYAKSASSCGLKAAGWSLGLTDNYGCSQCNKNSCPSISKTISSSSTTTATVSIQTSTDSDVANCGTTGSSGYTLDTTTYYSGDSMCYACTPKACPSGYTPTNQLTCSGLSVSHLSSYFGDDTCSKCRSTSKVCLIGTYPTQEECENSSDGGLIEINSQVSTQAISGGTIIGRNLCKQLSNGCWEPATVTKTCSAYTLTSCPTAGTCSSCETTSGTKKYKLDSCKTNYYKSGDKCVSCSSQQSTFKNYNTLAKSTWLNCCGTGCRGSTCSTSKNGSWIDGCLPIFYGIDDTTDVVTFIAACKKAMQGIKDEITDFNSKCPNYAITNLFSPYSQCSSVSINNNMAAPSYTGTESGKLGCN